MCDYTRKSDKVLKKKKKKKQYQYKVLSTITGERNNKNKIKKVYVLTSNFLAIRQL